MLRQAGGAALEMVARNEDAPRLGGHPRRAAALPIFRRITGPLPHSSAEGTDAPRQMPLARPVRITLTASHGTRYPPTRYSPPGPTPGGQTLTTTPPLPAIRGDRTCRARPGGKPAP